MADSQPKTNIIAQIHAELYKEQGLDVVVVCRRCTMSEGAFPTIKDAIRAGWIDLRPDEPSPANHWTHTGLCQHSLCQDHPEDSMHEEAA